MENTLSVAKYLNRLYNADNSKNMDQMRMHKMMYLVQRESLMYNKEPLFDAKFRGWKYGPVLQEVRTEYKTQNMFQSADDLLCDAAKTLVDSVYARYKELSSWKLSSLSHGELSWKRSRKGMKAEENGNVELRLADMKVDAAKELLRRNQTC